MTAAFPHAPSVGGTLTGDATPPSVSVVVPVRDEPAALTEALASVLAQDYQAPIEIVVADGSRGRETGDLVRERFPGVRLVANPDGGASAGLNRALAAAGHDIIVRCDAHSVLPPDYVRVAVAALARTGAAVVGGMQRPVGTTLFTRAVALAMATPLGAGDARYRLGGPEGPADTVYLGVFRRAALEAAGGFDETLARNQDYELNWRLRADGETVWFTPALAAAYRPRGSLAALARQYFGYGWWKRIVLARHPRSRRRRHLAAPLLTAALAVSAVLGAGAGAPALAPAPERGAAGGGPAGAGKDRTMSGPSGAPVLVSGGAGYVGSHLVLALREAGYRVVVVDDLSTGHRAAVPAAAVLIEADAGDRQAMAALIRREGIAAAIHLAGTAGVDEPPARARRSHAMSAAFIGACAEGGVTRFVLTSSAAVYAAPLSAYGAEKLRIEQLVREAFGGSGRAHAVLRCFNVAGADPRLRAGPGEDAGLVAAACAAALGLREPVTVFGTDYGTADGTCVRDYVHPSDVAAAHVAALRALERGSGSLTADCGSGRGHSVREVLAAVARQAVAAPPVREGPRRPGDVPAEVARPERIARLPGWRPRYPDLEVMVSTALAWTESRPRPDAPGGIGRLGPPGPPAGPAAAEPMAGDGYKRPFDLALVGAGLVLLAPLWAVLGLAVALAIRLEDGAPVLYRQARLGRHGKVFEILKFRTMVVGAEAGSGPVWAAPDDRRVTRVGRLLRRLHLDELPQAVNILRGDMSLVGPRPERPELAAHFERTVPGFSARLRVRPGVAGLAQALGTYHWAPRRKLHYDNLYIATMNPWLDLKLCLRCVARALLPRRRAGRRAGAGAGAARLPRRPPATPEP